ALVNQILGMSAKGGARGGVAAPPPAPSGSRASRLWKFLAPRIEWKSLLGSLAAYAALFWAWRLTKRHVPSTSMRMTVRVLLVMMMLSFSYVTYSRFLTRQINQVLGPGTGIQSMGDILGYVQRVKLQAEETRIVQEQMLLD
ncbi:MAG: hypothetical protein KC466_04835, partial [Myxococcales bacterium]|nr:hypothetical protein [Myxococcales bacterium]